MKRPIATKRMPFKFKVDRDRLNKPKQWWQHLFLPATLDIGVKITTMLTHVVVIVGGGAAACAYLWQTTQALTLKDDAKFNGIWTDEGCVDCEAPALGHYVTVQLTAEKGAISGVIDASNPNEALPYDESKAKTQKDKAIAFAGNYIWSTRYKFISLLGDRFLNTATVQIVDVVGGHTVNYGRAKLTAKNGVIEWHLIEGAEVLPKDVTLFRTGDVPKHEAGPASSDDSNTSATASKSIGLP